MQTNTTTSEAFGLRIGSIEGHGSQFRKGGEIVQEIDYYLFSKKIEQFPGGKI